MPRRRPDDEDEHDNTPLIGAAARRPLRDDEYPDEADDDDNDFDPGTDPCPYCGAEIFADGPWCPKCGKYLGEDDAPRPTRFGWPAWLFVGVVVLCLLAAVISSVG